jgi:cytochrome c biogenesis protein CcmG/thiol:disulfide interchange protein DsbE
LPHLDALNSKYAAEGVQVLAIDVTGRKELTQKMATEASYKAPVLVDDKGFSRQQYKVTATPTTCIVDPSGKTIFRHVGYGPGMEKVLEKEIELLLARKTA